MRTLLTFDIETIPDVEGIRILNHLPDYISDDDVVTFMQKKQREKTGRDFMPPHLQKVIAISCCMRSKEDYIRIGTVGEMNDSEEVIISRFFEFIDKYTPQLISWNGGGFDLPVLHYRGLICGITAQRYWDMGDGDNYDSRDFKWNNYINRYHMRHCDLMDLLAIYQSRNNVPLDEMAKLCGFPGKLGMDGSQVWQAYKEGRLAEIRDYCETDVANTYLMFLRFELMRGAIDADEYHNEIELIYQYLVRQKDKDHWQEFCEAWQR